MKRRKLNKTIAGYHLLMILSAVDRRFHVEEDLVIRDFLVHEFPFEVDLDNQMEIISGLLPEEWSGHFEQCMHDFEADGTLEDQNKLLDFAVKLIHADKVVTVEENEFVNKIFNSWAPEGL
jgi:hypothetical protein